MRPPFPSAAQAYAESIDSDTTSRHHPDARLTILPLPSLAALYPLDEAHTSSSHPHNSSNRSDIASDSSHRNLQVRLLHGNQQHPPQYQRQQPAFQSFEACVQKFNASSSPSVQSASGPPSPPHNTTMPNFQRTENERVPPRAKSSRPEYIGTSMESLLNAIEAHPDLSSSSLSRSPSPFSDGYNRSISSDSTSPFSSPPCTDLGVDYMSIHDRTPSHASASVSTGTNKARMSIRHLLDDTPDDKPTKPTLQQQHRANKSKSTSPKSPKSSSPTFSTIDITKRKWSNLSSANFEEERNAKIRRSIQDHVSGHANQSQMTSEGEAHSNFFPRQVFDTKDPSTRYQMTTICCLHASVAQKSYGSEKRFLCPPPIVTIQAPQGDTQSALSSKPQVTMSVVCENESNSSLGQRSTLEDNHSGTFRYLYVTGSAKAKSFQLKLQVYGQACLPNGFVSNDSSMSEAEEGMINTSDLPDPYAVFDSAPIAIISKPSKKTAKARNVSSCILAGSLVSLFNRINSQTVRTKYMSVQDDEFCAKNSTWSSFSITIVSNGPTGNMNNDNGGTNGNNSSTRVGSPKSHHRQSAIQSSSPITYGAEIILTETTTGLQSDRLIVCKVENGRILENATGPICQMQKVALMSTERRKDGQPLYLSAVGNDHQVGRYMDHSSATKTVLNYQPSTLASGNTDIMKPGSDDSLCWTIVGISKFEYTYFESLPADSESHYPITPFPTLMKNPVYNAASHTLELVVSNFFSKIGDETTEAPMGVWLGSRGPLTSHIVRRHLSTGAEGHPEQTTVSVDLPQGKQMGVGPDEKSLSLPLLFVRHGDGITYNSRATVVFTRPESGERWAVHMA